MGELGYGRSKGLGKQLVKELKKICSEDPAVQDREATSHSLEASSVPLFPEEGTLAVLLSEWKQTTQGEWMSS